VKTKKHAAWPAVAQQDALADLEDINLQLVVITDGFVNISTQLVQVVYLERFNRHSAFELLPERA